MKCHLFNNVLTKKEAVWYNGIFFSSSAVQCTHAKLTSNATKSEACNKVHGGVHLDLLWRQRTMAVISQGTRHLTGTGVFLVYQAKTKQTPFYKGPTEARSRLSQRKTPLEGENLTIRPRAHPPRLSGQVNGITSYNQEWVKRQCAV